MELSSFRRKWMSRGLIAIAVAIAAPAAVMADTFGPVHYDPKGDQIIVTMIYEGTSAGHHFSIRWGPCHKLHDQLHGPARQIIDVGILDDQGNDAATRSYEKVVRVPLAGLHCRPATVTLWTPPNHYTSLDIPGQR